MKIEQKRKGKNFIWRKILIILAWLFIWEIVARSIGNEILLEGPLGVMNRLWADLQTAEYYKTVLLSVFRIMSGLMAGMVLAIALGIFSYKNKIVGEIFLPVIQVLKAAPITCFVVLLLIWAGTEKLVFCVALLVTFPPIYFNLVEGLKQLDEKKLEVAKVYRMPLEKRLRYIYFPEIMPYFISSLTVAVGMAFKAGIAAEIIGTPDYSMGESIYMSKIYLDTAGVLSWMITVILVSYFCEKLIVKLAKVYFTKRPVLTINGRHREMDMAKDIQVKGCTLSYGKEVILPNINACFSAGNIYAITGQSGMGKTTFLKYLCGLKKAENKETSGNIGNCSMVFQENRLFEEFTAVENIYATGHCHKKKEMVENALAELLMQETFSKPVKEYSGGMKRRVEIARAMLSDGNVILMDEPFAGLDEDTKEKTIQFINKHRNDRTLIFTTHCPKDITKVKAEEYKL